MTSGDPQQPAPKNKSGPTDGRHAADLSPDESDAKQQGDTFTAHPSRTRAGPVSPRVGRLPEHFGRYRMLKILGEGGMGAVYLAEDSQLDRRVAIKVPFVTGNDGSNVVDRFHREAKALAAIVHPNICPIHEVGQLDGIDFIAMTYVEGKPLSEYIRPDKPLSIKQALLLVHKLASALHHAHAAGVIHRDLKPANIIINRLKEPVIMDFGLARREGSADAVATEAGQMLGTPAYMPPEQFAGDVAAMGPGCDIYSLGVILYELLTSRRPFTGDVMAIMSKVALEDPLPPSQHRQEINPQLDAICLKALAKRPEERFASMNEFSTVLADYFKTKPKRQSSAETPRATHRGGTIQAGIALDEQSVKRTGAPGPVEPSPVEPAANEPNHPAPAAPASSGSVAFPEAPTETGATTIRPVGEGYQLIKQLGAGQYGEVWLGMAPGGIEVAIKKLLFPVGHKATQVELQALELMKRLRHSFLVQVQAYWVMEDQLMIVMELADGSLEERLAECQRTTGQGIPREELFGYMREAAEAIDFLHQEQVLHRDIKPGNILLVKGHVKVADFGIATSGVMGANQLTTASATLGTPLYMGPELWDKQAGPRSDQYSLAVTYVELRLGGELVFDEQNRLDLSKLPEQEQAVLSKALAPNPRDRFESCNQFSQALDNIVESELREVDEQRHRELRQIEAQERQAIQAALDRRRRRRLQMIAGACILACLPVAWYVWTTWQSTRPSLQAQESITLTAGGEPVTLPVTRVGWWGDDPFEVTLEGDLTDVDVVSTQYVDEGAEITLAANLQSDSKEVEITLSAASGGKRVPRVVKLNVQEAESQEPPGWSPADWEVPDEAKKTRDVSGKIFYDRIVRILPKTGTKVDLVLIPATDNNGTRTFYCMRNKVSNKLFAEFAQDQPDKINPASQWKKGAPVRDESDRTRWLAAEDYPDNPVFGVGIADAYHFAVWFGGQLPNVKQWDTAFGRYDDATDAKGPWDATFAPGEIAIGRRSEGPLPVGTAAKDVSYFGCRDMAGNGLEWTRSHDDPQETFPIEEPEEFTAVFMKGRMYDENMPLRYGDLETREQVTYTAVEFTEDRPPLSFRCVVEFAAE